MAIQFELTEETLSLIDFEELSEPTQERLVKRLHTVFETKEEFISFLQDALTQKDFAKYRAVLLHFAAIPESYEVNGSVLANLETAGFPNATLTKLGEHLPAGVQLNRAQFETELPKAIGERQAKRFGGMLFQHCREPFLFPYYTCQIGDRQFLVDVTLSSPPQAQAPKVTHRFLGAFNGHFGGGAGRMICDMGAGKLRNLEPFLQAGYTAFICDYEDQYEYAASENRLEELQDTYGKERLQTWIFPGDFRNRDIQFDGILLFNVLNIIPFPGDRKLVLDFCVGKLKPGGLLAWLTPYGDTNMNAHCKQVNLPFGDGWILRPEGSRQTFYTEFRIDKIREMVEGYGLEELPGRIESGKNKAKIFRKP